VDCGKSGLEEGWVALGANPSVLNKMLKQDRHVLKGCVDCGGGLGCCGTKSFSS
jgi:hypothetical protein